MDRLENQRRLFLELIETLRPHWHRDRALPARLQRWLAARRAGSRDRRLYRELTYTALRVLPWIESAPPDRLVGIVAACARRTPETAAFIAAYALPVLPPECDPARLIPEWFSAECPAAAAPAQRDALLRRAPLWIRRQTTDADALRAELENAGWTVEPSPLLPSAWRLEGEGDLTPLPAYRDGRFEVQDLGSQLVLASVQIGPGERWLDVCAGAGGKTLQLAGVLGPDGRVDAHDIREAALAELRQRVARAGLSNVSVTTAPRGDYDGVLIDAPCTGTGTWRRAPHLKAVTRPANVAQAARLQGELLARWAPHARPGGRLVYATCSLCRTENEAVVERFLETHPGWHVEPVVPPAPLRAGPFGLTILPGDLDSDGFFVAVLRNGQTTCP